MQQNKISKNVTDQEKTISGFKGLQSRILNDEIIEIRIQIKKIIFNIEIKENLGKAEKVHGQAKNVLGNHGEAWLIKENDRKSKKNNEKTLKTNEDQ